VLNISSNPYELTMSQAVHDVSIWKRTNNVPLTIKNKEAERRTLLYGFVLLLLLLLRESVLVTCRDLSRMSSRERAF
jgi:hypothetical protein